MRSRRYEITVTGQAGPGVRAELDDCTITVGPGSTTLRAELPDQCAMSGLIQRIIDLRLEITRVLLVPHHDAGGDSKAAAGDSKAAAGDSKAAAGDSKAAAGEQRQEQPGLST